MYNGSPEHIDNLAKARKAIPKINCTHCGDAHLKNNITKHEKSCKENPDNQKECPVCKKMHAKKSATCSYSCSNSYFRSGPDNPNWKQESYRTTCFYHHDKKCVVCDESNIVEVHHFNGNHSDNRPENLVPLCPTHHQYWHSKHRPLIEERVQSYVDGYVRVLGIEPSP